MKHASLPPRLSSRSLWLMPLFLAACGGGGGGGGGVGGGGGGNPGPIPATTISVHAGLIAACPGSGEVRIEWDLPGSEYDAQYFHSSSSATILAGAGVTATGNGATITGLANGQTRFFALGIRPTGSGAYQLAGQILRAVPRAPIYVDAAATAPGNGTLATPYTSLQTAANAAAAAGGNLWVRDGSYSGPVVVRPGTHVYGGFPTGSAFTLANRSSQASATIVGAGTLQAAIDAQPSATPLADRIVLDGLVLRGNSAAEWGVDTQKADIDLRSLTISGFVGRGIRMVNLGLGATTPNEAMNAQVVNVTSQQNGADGLSVLGAYNLGVDFCRFDANGQEGFELGPLYALNGTTATVHVTATRCSNNAAEGFDASLAQPTGQASGSADFDVDIVGCTFDGNGLDGLLVDQEHEALAGWRGNIAIRECSASNNALAGVHVDADGPGEFLIHRVRAIANGTDGVFVSSEATGGHVVVSACLLAGNLDVGLDTSLGNKRLLATHCLFTGNDVGGFVARAVECGAANCVAYLQTAPFTNVRQLGTPTVTDNSLAAFANVPTSYAKVTAHTTGTLTLAAAAGFATGATVEIADDGTARTAAQVAGTTVVLGNTPTLRRVPTMLMVYPSTTVAENTQLAASSTLAGLGMKETGTSNVDPGPFGGPVNGAPGVAEDLPDAIVWLDQITPAAPTALGSSTSIVLRFSQTLSTGTVTGPRVRVVDQAGNAVAALLSPSGNQITVTPPGGGWPTGTLRLELHRGITATDGSPLQPVIVPLR